MIDQKQLENVEYFKYLDSIITNDAKCTNGMKSRIAMAKAPFKKIKKEEKPFHQQIGLEFKKEMSNMFNVEHCSVWC
jgi:hypothetical protein